MWYPSLTSLIVYPTFAGFHRSIDDKYGVKTQCVIGVDLGGTNVRAAAVDASGQFHSDFVERPSMAQSGARAVIEACDAVIRAVASKVECVGVGMAVPGHIDTASGTVLWAPNFGETKDGMFRHFSDVPLAGPVSALSGLPVVIGNDANLAALGEFRFGIGKGTANGLVMITLGTGIGGGVVLSPGQLDPLSAGEPVLLVGANGGGAELGHVVVMADGPLCGCGAYGCLEALANATAIAARGRAKLEHDATSLIGKLSGGDGAKVTPKLLADAAGQGDAAAIEVWQETGHYLGIGIGSFINTFVPEIVAIGGQIAKVGAPLLDAAIRSAKNVAIPTLFSATRIVPAVQIDHAGVLGGAALAFRSIG